MSKFPIIIETNKPSGIKYKNCRMLNYHRYGDHPKIRRAIQALCVEMGYKGTIAEKQAKVLTLDLYHCFKGDKSRYLKFYLNPNFYESIQRYNWFSISFRPVKQIVGNLHRLGYIEMRKGFRDKKTGHTETSKMKANPKLVELLEQFGVKPGMICTWKDEELIILKRETKKVRVNGRWKKIKPKIKYCDTKLTIAMRKVLVDYNGLLAKTHIDIDTTGYIYKRKVKERYRNDPRKHMPLKFDLADKKVKRIFNGDFRKGGRFYGIWVQGCPESLRQHVVIDGEHVYEFDFAGMHIHLLYSWVGSRLGDKEPYVLPKTDEHSKMRRVYKLIMLTAVNCKSDPECFAAVESELIGEMEQEPDKWPSKIPDLETMLRELKEHHKPIAKFINKSTGLPLQYVDSSIAEHVIIKMTARAIPVICIHDSFLCKVSDAKIVHQAMKEAFIEIITRQLEGSPYTLTLELDDVLTTECKESDERIPGYRRMFSIANMVTWAHVFNNGYARRRLMYLITSNPEFNEVVTINPTVEYY